MGLFWFLVGILVASVLVVVLAVLVGGRREEEKAEEDEAITKAFRQVYKSIRFWREDAWGEIDKLKVSIREQSIRDYRVNQAYVDASLRVHEAEFHAPKKAKK
jgi:hypothetical protein